MVFELSDFGTGLSRNAHLPCGIRTADSPAASSVNPIFLDEEFSILNFAALLRDSGAGGLVLKTHDMGVKAWQRAKPWNGSCMKIGIETFNRPKDEKRFGHIEGRIVPKGEGVMKRTFYALLIVAWVWLGFVDLEGQPGPGDTRLFESEGMRGVSPDFLSPVSIRDVMAPGAPWAIDRGEVKIEKTEIEGVARVRVEVRGLVLDPEFVASPPGGTNPAANFRAIVSCIDAVDGTGTPTFTNVVSDLFPADSAGNAELDTLLPLPDPCLGIIVFVTSPTERWFAITGF